MNDGSGLRIVQLANFVGPVSGGMRQAIDQLGRGYAAAGAERILVVPGRTDAVHEDDAGVVVQVRAPKISESYRMIAEPWRVFRAVKRFAPTSLECSDKWTLSPAGNWARRHNVGSVLFSHERLTDMASMWFRRQFGVTEVVGAMNRRLAKEFDAVVCTSRYALEEFAGTGAHLVHVPLGVDLATFRPGLASPPDDGVLHLCYVGRMSHEKSPQLDVAAAVELHRRGVPIQLDMYGFGPDLDALRAQAGSAPVRFHGYVSGRDEIARIYAAHHISMSVCPAETFGLAVLEALASGTPVVTANVGGARELVTDECGEWDEATPEGIADAVERLGVRLRDPHAASAIRAAARERAERYTWDASVDAMLGLHRELAEGRWREWDEH